MYKSFSVVVPRLLVPFFQIFVRWVPLYFSTFPKLAFFGLPTVCWGRRRDVAKVAFGRTCCFSILFAAAFLVAGGVASSVSCLFFTARGFSDSCFLPFSRRRRQRWPLRRQPRPRGRGRGPKCPPFSHACFRAAEGQQAYGIQNIVFTMITRSVAFKEEQGSNTECCIERRVHPKNTNEDRPCRRP